ncbi:p53, partial [Operophtera brumata]
YSHRLNRIYVDKECDFSVLFNWDSTLGATMWARACVVFADEAQAQKRPECCLQHLHQGFNAGVNKHIRLNVLHSSRPMGTQGVEYHGCADAADSWLSTAVELSKPGSQPVAHAYKFVCKSSCSGTVFGRQLVGARVCACPRRDMNKDEESEGGLKSKRRAPGDAPQPRPTKKIKVEPSETEERVLTLPPVSADAAAEDARVLTLPPVSADAAGGRACVRLSASRHEHGRGVRGRFEGQAPQPRPTKKIKVEPSETEERVLTLPPVSADAAAED